MGGDVAQVTWTSAHQDSVYQFATAPMVGVTVGKSSFYGRAAAGQPVSVVLRTSSGAVRGRAHLTVDARATGFTLIFRDGNGHSVPVRSGDRVTGDWATNATFDVPDMHFTPIPIYHLFYGWCMPNAPYTLTLLMAGYQAETTSGTTGANGETPLMQVSGHVKTGETMTLACALPTGDVVTFSQLVP